jgi:hypothetical protein
MLCVALKAGDHVQRLTLIRRTRFSLRNDQKLQNCILLGKYPSQSQGFLLTRLQDHYTTDYFLPDGSYGSASNGSYTTPNGDTANLVTGEYHMKDGTSGNIYTESPADQPDTSEMTLPTPYTSSGIDPAIPASMLGAQTSTGPVTASTPATTTSSSSPTSQPTPASTPSSDQSSQTAPGIPTITEASSSHISTITVPTIIGGMPSSSSSYGQDTSSSLPSPYLSTSLGANNSTASPSATVPKSSSTGASGASGVSGDAGTAASSVNTSRPIIPPITNLAAATVVYCMTAKILVWIAATIAL